MNPNKAPQKLSIDDLVLYTLLRCKVQDMPDIYYNTLGKNHTHYIRIETRIGDSRWRSEAVSLAPFELRTKIGELKEIIVRDYNKSLNLNFTESTEHWFYFDNVLPEDGQNITVLDEGQDKELERTFYLEFWREHGRVIWCSEFTKKWRPRP